MMSESVTCTSVNLDDLQNTGEIVSLGILNVPLRAQDETT